MRFAVGSDHAGSGLKTRIVPLLEAERGVVVCGSEANVLALAGRRLDEHDAAPIVRAFPGTDFEGGRHGRRVDRIADIEGRSE